MLDNDGPGDLQLLQTGTDTGSEPLPSQNQPQRTNRLTSSGVITPVSLNLDSCQNETHLFKPLTSFNNRAELAQPSLPSAPESGTPPLPGPCLSPCLSRSACRENAAKLQTSCVKTHNKNTNTTIWTYCSYSGRKPTGAVM